MGNGELRLPTPARIACPDHNLPRFCITPLPAFAYARKGGGQPRRPSTRARQSHGVEDGSRVRPSCVPSAALHLGITTVHIDRMWGNGAYSSLKLRSFPRGKISNCLDGWMQGEASHEGRAHPYPVPLHSNPLLALHKANSQHKDPLRNLRFHCKLVTGYQETARLQTLRASLRTFRYLLAKLAPAGPSDGNVLLPDSPTVNIPRPTHHCLIPPPETLAITRPIPPLSKYLFDLA